MERRDFQFNSSLKSINSKLQLLFAMAFICLAAVGYSPVLSAAAFTGGPTGELDSAFNSLRPNALTLLGGCLPTVTVTSNADSGAGSLRQAVADVCPAGTINFSNVTSPITLTGGEIVINKNMTITGPGAALLAVSGNNNSRVFFISNNSTVTISGLTIRSANGNSTQFSGFGGAILVVGGSFTLNDSVVTGNTTSGTSAGIAFAFAAGSINRTTFSNNTGGNTTGVYLQDGTLTVNSSTISGNSGGDSSDAIRVNAANNGTTSLTMINSTVSGNTAANNASALTFQSGSGTTTAVGNLINCTITKNSTTNPSQPGAIWQQGGGNQTLNLQNTIVSGNTSGGAPFDITGTVSASSSFNLIGTGGGLTNGVNSNITGVNNPGLTPLASNGGPTQTHSLATNSPATDKGSAVTVPFWSGKFDSTELLPPLTTDQRGRLRPFDLPSVPNAAGGDGSDIGAYESQAIPTAAAVMVSGSVSTSEGRSIMNAVVTIIDVNGVSRSVRTNSFGRFNFTNVIAGATYTIVVLSKGYTFNPQVVSIDDEVMELSFIGF